MGSRRSAAFLRGSKKLLSPALAILFALLLTGILIYFMGFDPLEAYATLFKGAFQGKAALSETVVCAVPLLFSSLSFAISYQCGVFNIGAGGQLYMGAVLATYVGVLPGMPPALQLPLALLAGVLGGALWGLIVGWLKVRFGANEMITTIMFNYIAMLFASFCVAGPMKGSSSLGLAQSDPVAEGVRLARFLPGTRLHTGLFLAIAILVVYGVFIWRSKKGFEFRVMGLNKDAAAYAGINVQRNILLSMLLAGGVAGLGGCVEILAIQGKLSAGFAGNIGFDGITVALLGNCSPLGILFSSLLFGALSSGSNKMQMLVGVPSATTTMIQAFIILAMITRGAFRLLPANRMKKREAKLP